MTDWEIIEEGIRGDMVADVLRDKNTRLLAVARAAALHLAEADGVDQKIYNIRKLKAALAAVEDLL